MLGKNSEIRKLLKEVLIFLVPMLIFSHVIIAQVNIPEVVAKDLNGKTITIPKDLNGKKSLIGFALTPKNQDQLVTWAQPIYDELLDENSLASMVYDVNVVLVICFNKTNIKFKKRVLKELKENVLNEFYDNVVLTEADSKQITEGLEIKNKETINLYTLDISGDVTSHTTGSYSEKKFDNLSNHLEIE